MYLRSSLAPTHHLSTTSIAVSRVVFSIHSLAAKLGADSAWLLNNLERSRVKWRTRAHEGELIVERGCGDVEESAGSHVPTINSSHSVRVTRVCLTIERGEMYGIFVTSNELDVYMELVAYYGGVRKTGIYARFSDIAERRH